MTSVELSTRMPDWRSASPKKRKTRSPKICPRIFPQNLMISPKEANHSRGTANQEEAFI